MTRSQIYRTSDSSARRHKKSYRLRVKACSLKDTAPQPTVPQVAPGELQHLVDSEELVEVKYRSQLRLTLLVSISSKITWLSRLRPLTRALLKVVILQQLPPRIRLLQTMAKNSQITLRQVAILLTRTLVSKARRIGKRKRSQILTQVAPSLATMYLVSSFNSNPSYISLYLTMYAYLMVLGKSLGKGTFGKVKMAEHILTKESVAIKILEKARIKDRKDIDRISREIKILKKVRHPNVIQLYEVSKESFFQPVLIWIWNWSDNRDRNWIVPDHGILCQWRIVRLHSITPALAREGCDQNLPAACLWHWIHSQEWHLSSWFEAREFATRLWQDPQDCWLRSQ